MTLACAPGEIRASGLTRRFGATVAVRPFELRVGPGGITGLLGPNGSGKSTLLRMLLGLVPADGGSCAIDGVDLTGDGTGVRRRATYAPGEVALYGELTGRAHLRWLVAGRGRAALARAMAIAGELELPLQRRVRGYSHGMKRQLLLAAALGPVVRVRVLDEPTEGLDPSKRGHVLRLLAAEAAAGTTILLSSHHLGEVDRICDHMLFLRKGELLQETEAARLHERARRLVRVAWTDPEPEDALRAALAELGADEVRVDGRHASFLLPAADPPRALARILERGRFAAPESLTYGELSLQELYRELYGTEGV